MSKSNNLNLYKLNNNNKLNNKQIIIAPDNKIQCSNSHQLL